MIELGPASMPRPEVIAGLSGRNGRLPVNQPGLGGKIAPS